jgi:branched-chain amino acid transport system ATP-binding protein
LPLLQVEDIHTYIGRFHILQGVTFQAEDDKATILLGRNGAGKTTTLRSIMGMAPARSGKILFKDQDITKLPPFKIARKGIAYIPSKRRIFSYLTVEENMKLAFRSQKSNYQDRLSFVLNIFPDLKEAMKVKARHLSGGQQKMLLVARALINENELMLVDEPTEGLSPLLIKKFTETFLRLKEHVPFILVEQNFKLANEVGDDCYVLDMGKIVYKGSMQEVAQNKELLKRHLGVTV